MRKFIVPAAGWITAAAVLMSAEAAAGSRNEPPQDAAQLLHQLVKEAVRGCYREPRQYWRQEVLRVQKVPTSPYYEVAG